MNGDAGKEANVLQHVAQAKESLLEESDEWRKTGGGCVVVNVENMRTVQWRLVLVKQFLFQSELLPLCKQNCMNDANHM